MIRILSKGQGKVRIGYTTHNGAEATVAIAPNREYAQTVCELARLFCKTNKEQARFVNKYHLPKI